jgi:hypothetical protein
MNFAKRLRVCGTAGGLILVVSTGAGGQATAPIGATPEGAPAGQAPAPTEAAPEGAPAAQETSGPWPMGTPPSTVSSTAPVQFPQRGPGGPAPAPTFEFHPGVRVSEEYSDNFNLTARNKQDNFRTTVAPEFTLFLNGARTTGELGYTLSGIYDSSDESTRLFHALRGRVDWQANPRLRLEVWDAFTRSDNPYVADQLNLRRERSTFTQNTTEASAEYQLDTITARAYYRYSLFSPDRGDDTASNAAGANGSIRLYQLNTVRLWYEYLDSDLSGASGVRGHQLTLSAERQLNQALSVGVAGSYAFRTAQGPISGIGPNDGNREDDYTIGSGVLFLRYQIPQTWSLAVSGGYSVLNGRGGFDDTSPVGSGLLIVQLARATLSLGGDVGFSETFSGGQNFGVVKTWGVRGTISYP